MKAKDQSDFNILLLRSKKEPKSNGEHESKHLEYTRRETCRLCTKKPRDLNLKLLAVSVNHCTPINIKETGLYFGEGVQKQTTKKKERRTEAATDQLQEFFNRLVSLGNQGDILLVEYKSTTDRQHPNTSAWFGKGKGITEKGKKNNC